MTPQALAERNASKLLEVWPPMRPKVKAILRDLQGHGWRPRIQVAWRSLEEQREVRRQGRSGVTYGYHNTTGPHGQREALAVDIVNDGNPYEEPQAFYEDLASSAVAHGLETGINWSTPHDPWHVQVTNPSIAQARRGVRPSWG